MGWFRRSVIGCAAVGCGSVGGGGGCGPTVTPEDNDDVGVIEDGSDTGDDPMTSMGTVNMTTGVDPDEGSDGVVDTGGGAATNEVDILIVVDNSSSMGEEQALLAEGVGNLVDVLDTLAVDYRVGVTTTDNGNPWCTGTTPEAGSLRMSSCRSRQSEFVFQGASGVDATQEACLDVCGAEVLNVTPTTTAGDSNPAPRPWLEVTDGVSNVSGMTPADALGCMLPQGINGCGFEQQLESTYKAIKRSESQGEAGFGFLRAGALAVVIIVSDEADCSHDSTQDTIFLPDDDRTFWSMPESPSPTSAVCWNAGVACEGGDCSSVNLDPLGAQTSEANAVMRPVSRYIGVLQDLEDANKQVTPGADVLVELVGGFGQQGALVYPPSMGTDFENDFGSSAACESGNGPAVPMVRMVEVAAAFDNDGVVPRHSICEASFGPAFTAIADRIANKLE